MNQNSIFILIHGAWHGSWCWRKVSPLLKQMGHVVLTPDLPGHGTPSISFKGITLTTYVDFLIDLIDAQPAPVYLVGHSLGGVIISQVAEQIPHKIAKLIYVASLLPVNNSSCVQEASQQSLNNAGELLRPNEQTNEMIFLMRNRDKVRNAFYHCCSENDFEYVMQHLQVEPLAPMVTPIQITPARFGQVNKSYIACLQDRGVEIDNQLRMAKNANITNIISLDCDHSPFLSMPQELALSITADHT